MLERMDPAFLADALTSLGLGYWSWDLASNKVVWSENMGAILGLPAGSLGGDFDSFLSLLHPEDQPRFQAAIDRALSRGGNYEVEFRVLGPGGAVQWISGRGHVVLEDGKAIRMTSVAADATQRRRADEDRRLLASIVSSSDDAIIGKDLDGRIVSWNLAAERMYGYNAEEAIGQSVAMLLPPNRSDDFFKILERIRRGEKIEHYETVRRRRDGALLDVSLTVSPIYDESGRIIGASKIARDITALKAAELERERTRDLFVGILGHDLRNPLNTIVASLFTLERHAPEPLRHIIPRISRSADRMTRLIDELLDFTRARLGAGIEITVRPSDLKEICSGVADEQEVQHPGRIRFHAEGSFAGKWDGDRIAQALSNLIGNALQHGSASDPVEISLARENGAARLEVVNRGNPIPNALLPTIFEPFRRGLSAGKSHPQGLGLGLFITREIVRAHGGTIQVASNEKGTSFVIRLPFRDPSGG
jgi:PAS domain S-box-containing protein